MSGSLVLAQTASYPVFVHQPALLLPASFRHSLASLPLRFATLHLRLVGRGCSPPSYRSCPAHHIALGTGSHPTDEDRSLSKNRTHRYSKIRARCYLMQMLCSESKVSTTRLREASILAQIALRPGVGCRRAAATKQESRHAGTNSHTQVL